MTKCQNIAVHIANSGDRDQIAPVRSSLIWVYTICMGTTVPTFRIILEALKLLDYNQDISYKFKKTTDR